MFKIILIFTIFIISIPIAGFTDQAKQVITLKDGSQIKGDLSGIENGIYTIRTPTIGDVHVAASDVTSITNSNASAPAVLSANNPAPDQSLNPTSSMDQQIAASQKQLMNNPQSMATLQDMMQDPEIMKALQDPDLVQAVTSHNYQAVQKNPKIQELMSNPKMQALMQKLEAQQQAK